MWLWAACAVSRLYFSFLLSALCFRSVAALSGFSRFEVRSSRFKVQGSRFKVQGSRFKVQGSRFGVYHKPSEYNPPPAPPSGWSGGTLDKPWTCPIPIEPPQTPVIDQPSLSIPLSFGIFAAKRLKCAADLWAAGAWNLRLCGPSSAELDF